MYFDMAHAWRFMNYGWVVGLGGGKTLTTAMAIADFLALAIRRCLMVMACTLYELR